MYKLLFITLFLVGSFAKAQQIIGPDFTNKEDLKQLGVGRIIQKDNSIYKKIKLLEIKDYWIIYEKSESTHDMMMESINWLEFPDSKWGSIIIQFPNNKPEVSHIQY